MKRLLTILSIWLVSAYSMAYASLPTVPGFQNADTGGDLSLHYLGKIFGDVPGALVGGGSQLIGHIFYVFNQGIMVVAAVWLLYTIFNVMVTTTLSAGGAPRHNISMVVLRVAVGLAMLVPSSDTGYCAVQDLMMKVVVEGVRFADTTWSYALTELAGGDKLYVPETGGNKITSLRDIDKLINTDDLHAASPIRQVLDDEICMKASMLLANDQYDYAVAHGTLGHRDQLYVRQAHDHPMSVIAGDPPKMKAAGDGILAGTGRIAFPGYGQPYPYKPTEISDGFLGDCGTLEVTQLMPKHATEEQYQAAYAAITQITLDLNDAATNAAGSLFGKVKLNAVTIGGGLARATADYLKQMKPLADASTEAEVQSQGDFIDKAKDEGWLNAGSYYWDLARLNDAHEGLGLVNMVPHLFERGMSSDVVGKTPIIFIKIAENFSKGLAVKDELTKKLTDKDSGVLSKDRSNNGGLPLSGDLANMFDTRDATSLGDLVQYYQSDAYRRKWYEIHKHDLCGRQYGQHECNESEKAKSFEKDKTNQIAAAKDKMENPMGILSFDLGKADPGSILGQAGGHVLDYIMKTEAHASNRAYYDPISFAHGLGKACLGAGGYVWTKAGENVKDSITKGAWYSIIPVVGKALETGNTAYVNFSIPLWTGASAALFSAGFMLAYYAPLYPYLLFFFGGVSWILSVLEAMVAAPLVCLGLTHPDGQDFTGKAEQAIMLALGVFLRPVLMVIGFLSGMILSYVSFSMINHIFSRVIDSLDGQTDSKVAAPMEGIISIVNGGAHNLVNTGQYTQNGFADFIVFILLVVAYGFIAMEVINLSFSAIHQVPNMVLRWIGGPQQQDRSEALAGKVQQGLSSASRQAGEMGGKATTGAAQAQGEKSKAWIQTGGNMAKSGVGMAGDATKAGLESE